MLCPRNVSENQGSVIVKSDSDSILLPVKSAVHDKNTEEPEQIRSKVSTEHAVVAKKLARERKLYSIIPISSAGSPWYRRTVLYSSGSFIFQEEDSAAAVAAALSPVPSLVFDFYSSTLVQHRDRFVRLRAYATFGT
ncbi:unnamed protein product [Calypogeia fissa]